MIIFTLMLLSNRFLKFSLLADVEFVRVL